MTALVTKHLPLVSGAPDGFKAMRGLILELALRGKLTPQDKRDEPATELLRRIAEEQAELIANGVIRQPKQPPELSSDSVEFDLPTSWRWASVASLVLQITDGTHHTPTYLPSGVPFISVKDIDGKTINFNGCKYISKEQHKDINARCNPEAGDILLCRIGTLGRPTIVDTAQPFSLFVSVGLLKLPKKSVIARFLHLALSSPLLCRQYEVIKAGGSHTNKLNLGDIPRLCVPVPPLAEQQRIVAKVDELMALCDRLEADQADAEAAHAQLVQALLGSLTQGTDSADFRASWQRLSEHFHTLFTTEASIDALKQTVLQLAVIGKLVSQVDTDESASSQLEAISSVLRPKGPSPMSKKSRVIAEVESSEQYAELPNSWVWTRLGAIVTESGAGWSPSCESRQRIGEEWGVLKVSAVSWGEYRAAENKALPANLDARPEHEVQAGDFLVSRANTAELVARSVVVESTPPRLMLCDKIVRLKLTKLCNLRFIHLVNSAPASRAYYSAVAGGTSSSMKNVSREQILNLALPLPPLAEQHRIVAKVDELMALCDQLKAQLQQARQQHAQLASVLVDQAVA
jgi:type I restriction enzyme, S subunit